MSRFLIFLVMFVCFVMVLSKKISEKEKNTHNKSNVHLRRHKRTYPFPNFGNDGQVMFLIADPRCMLPGLERPMMACPRRNSKEQLRCVEADEICDDIRDCPGGEDEMPSFCMFKKLEDAEMRRLKTELYSLIDMKQREAAQKHDIEYFDVPVYLPMNALEKSPTQQSETVKDPLAAVLPASNKDYNDEEEDEEPEQPKPSPAEKFRKHSRAKRHQPNH